jgi:hypothetical protein
LESTTTIHLYFFLFDDIKHIIFLTCSLGADKVSQPILVHPTTKLKELVSIGIGLLQTTMPMEETSALLVYRETISECDQPISPDVVVDMTFKNATLQELGLLRGGGEEVFLFPTPPPQREGLAEVAIALYGESDWVVTVPVDFQTDTVAILKDKLRKDPRQRRAPRFFPDRPSLIHRTSVEEQCTR